MSPRTRNSLWMLLAGLGFAIMGVCVKVGAKHFSTAELVFYRSLFGLLFISLFVVWRGIPLKTSLWKRQLSRSLTGFAAMMMFFYALTHIPVSMAVTLNYTSPVFLGLFMAIWLRHKPHPMTWLAILIGFFGVVLLLNPSLHGTFHLAGWLGLISGMLTALVFLQVTSLGRLGEPEWRTVFYFSLVCVTGSALWIASSGFHPPGWQYLPNLVGMGASATIAQLAMTRAYGRGDTLTTGNLAYSAVLFASLFDLFLWRETLSPLNIAAILIVIGSGLLSIRVSASRNPPPTA